MSILKTYMTYQVNTDREAGYNSIKINPDIVWRIQATTAKLWF